METLILKRNLYFLSNIIETGALIHSLVCKNYNVILCDTVYPIPISILERNSGQIKHGHNIIDCISFH